MPENRPALELVSSQSHGPVYWLHLDTPPFGGKGYLLETKGVFVLERGPTLLRTIACTHAGSGSLAAFDGVPDHMGFFPDRAMTPPPDLLDDEYQELHRHYRLGGGKLSMRVSKWIVDRKAYDTRNGRALYRATPTVMGSWMLDAGCVHGLTVQAVGGREEVSAVASIVWQPAPQKRTK